MPVKSTRNQDDEQPKVVATVEDAGKEVNLNLDEGKVYADPEKQVVGDSGEVEGVDEGGVYAPQVTAPYSAGVIPTAPTKKVKDNRVVLTNTRFPEMRIAITETGDDGRPVRTGRYAQFHSTKLVTDEETARKIEALNKPYIFREDANFASLPADSKDVFRHDATGFRTSVKEAYEDWTNNSEWSAKPR